MIARVPATSANLGPGFDSLGLALTIWAEVGLVAIDGSAPEGAHLADDHHLAAVAFARCGGIGRVWVRSPIPMARGLGYSAAVRVGGALVACGRRCADPVEVLELHSEEVLAVATELEGHADNAAPALFGGVIVSAGERSIRVPLPRSTFDPAIVVWVPDAKTRTDRSRAQLGAAVALADAVFNIGRTGYLVAALASGDVEALHHATQDRIHQDVRFLASPQSRVAADAAVAAGAWCSWLSGSGPTIAAMCATDRAIEIAAALPSGGRTKVLAIDHRGASVHADGDLATI